MTDLTPIESDDNSGRAIEDTRHADRCNYCGVVLHPSAYFCLGCGTPYKDSSLVVSKALPPVMDESELIRRKAPSVWALFWSYVGVLIFGFIATTIIFKEDRPDLQMVFMDIVLLVLTCVWASLHWRTLWVQFKRAGLHPATPIALALLFPLLGINFLYSSFIEQLISGADESFIDPIEQLKQSGISKATLIVTICLFPAITEEIAFRGLIQHWLVTAIKPWRAIVLASFLFAAMHFSIISLPYLFVVGLLLGWVKWKTGSLYPAMLIHFLHNLVVIEYF